MILGDFLSRQKHNDSNPHEIIPILFNMKNILQSRYYNIGKGNEGKYLVQTRLKAKSSGISLPEVHGAGKGLYLNILPEKQVIKSIITSEAKGVTHIHPRLGQSRAGIKQKIALPMSALFDRPLIQLKENPISQQPQNLVQPKITSKVPVQESSLIHDKIIPVPDYVVSTNKNLR